MASELTLTVNGAKQVVKAEGDTPLIYVLRNELKLTGPRMGCGMAQCGSCAVLVDGEEMRSCVTSVSYAVGKKVTTVEGLGTPEKMNSVQAAFVEKDGMMCGFCTPGFVTTLSALLAQNPNPTEQQVREACHGNFCRCGTYPHIFAAAQAAQGKK